jgi:hypothetical protein
LKPQDASEVRIRIPGQYESRYSSLPTRDLGAVSSAADRKVEFVVGQDFLKPLVLVVDPLRRVFHFVPSGSFKTPVNTRQLPLSSVSPPQIVVKLDRKEAIVALDTGFSGQLSLSTDASAKLAPTGTVREIEFGNFEARNIRIESVAAQTGDGRLGMGLLSKVRFALDITAGSLWVGAPTVHVDDDD